MGAGESKFCSSCDKVIKAAPSAMPTCHFCKKIVCTGCSNKEAPGNGKSTKIRVCHVCKVNINNREGSSQGEEIIASKPKDFKKVINVSHDNKTGTYSGLPTVWRELLEMPLSSSKNEMDTRDLDATIAPVQPSKRMLYQIQEKNAEGEYMISAPSGAVKTFQVKFDFKLGKLVGLPQELEPYAVGFKPEDFEKNPQAVMDAMEATRKYDEE